MVKQSQLTIEQQFCGLIKFFGLKSIFAIYSEGLVHLYWTCFPISKCRWLFGILILKMPDIRRMKVGQTGLSSILCCGWFLLMMLHSPVYAVNERKLGSPKTVNMQPSKIGRKFGFSSEFSTREYVAVRRTLLGENTTISVSTERISGKEKIQEPLKNQTNSEIKVEKRAEPPLSREIQAKNGTIKLKEKPNLKIVENETHDKTGENNNAAKSANKDAQEIKIEAERLSNSSKGGTGVESPANSTEIGIQKTEGDKAQTSANQTDNLEPTGSSASSTGTEVTSSANSTDAPKSRNSTDIEIQRMQSPTDIKTQAMKISDAKTLTANSTVPKLQAAEGIPTENSTTLQISESTEAAKGLANPKDGENPSFQNKASADSRNVADNERPTFPKAENRETPANSTDVEIQDPEDEYSDLMQDFADLPSKLQDTAEKVAGKLMPGIQRLHNTSKAYFDIANQGIAESFSPLIGKQYAPVAGSAITCILLLLPIILAIAMFEHVRAFFPLQKVIFLANIYLANYFATLAVASFIVGMEPMLFFYRNSLSGYICLQLVQGFGYALYMLLQCLNAVVSCSRGRILARAGAALQCAVAICVGLHYYVTVFHRAMAQNAPRTCWKVHGTYSLLFLLLCLLSKPMTDSGKKEYLFDGNTNKKN